MADPRLEGDPTQRKPVLSRLMRAMLANKDGQKLNFCPHGCEDDELDENGYCRHLVGFTNDKKTYEPMLKRKGRRVVQVARSRVKTGVDDDGADEYAEGPPEPAPCQPGDKFEQITTSWRVYRDVDKQTQAVDEKAQKAPIATEKGQKKAG